MDNRASLVPEISLIKGEITLTGMKFSPYKHSLTKLSCEKSHVKRSTECRGFSSGIPVFLPQRKLTGWVRINI